jgi:NAD(P)-dependent dehydrogenase (short-subunit alcohol dehydrogenase family)
MKTILDKFNLKDRVAVVTGGAGLLGAEFCRTLAEAGAAVAVVDLNTDKCAATADALTQAGYRALAVPTDITRPESVNALVEKVLSTLGRLDVLVNSAALDPKFDPDADARGIAPGKFEDYPLDQWNVALGVNLTGMFLVTQACVRPMLAQGKKGSIINICSTYGLNGPDQRIYKKKDGSQQAFKPVY